MFSSLYVKMTHIAHQYKPTKHELKGLIIEVLTIVQIINLSGKLKCNSDFEVDSQRVLDA